MILSLSSLLTSNLEIGRDIGLQTSTCTLYNGQLFNRPSCALKQLFQILCHNEVLELCSSLGLGNIRLTSVQHSFKL